MKNIRSLFFAATALLLTAVSGQAVSVTAYALSNNGETLISFDLSNPTATTVVGNISGATTFLDGIDFRPATGLLYGYDTGGNQVVTINLSNAVTTLVSNPSTGSGGFTLGIDFNPVADRLRLVNAGDQNLRFNVDTGATTVDGTLAYAFGDANFGVNPFINEAAYTNSDTNPATVTQLFYLDYGLDTLVTTSNPNGGLLNTVGSLGVDTDARTGFDILSDGLGGNLFYGILSSISGPSLYSINSTTGAASLIGGVGASNVFGLAIVQTPAPGVPDSGTTLALFGLALTGLGFVRRKFAQS